MDSRRTFIKQAGLGTAGLALAPAFATWAKTLQVADPLPRSTPEQQGVSSDTLNKFFDAMDSSDIDFHSVMVLRNGYVIGEGWWWPYGSQYKHSLYSLSKSFTSAAVGLAINEGYFNIESPVISFFPELLPKEVSPNLAAMKVKHLLTMTTGHAEDNGLRGDAVPWVQSILAAPIVHEPGTFYVYNTSATYTLSAIVQKTTGKTLLEFLTPRLFNPLKIENADWEVSPQGINTGGYGLRLHTEDIAKFSQLYLDKGKWKGKQIIPESWVEASTKKQWTFTSNPFGGKSSQALDDWQQGYGYQFWRTQHNGYRSDGLYGQFGIVLPDQKTVVVITEECFNTQKTLNFVWNELLPGLSAGMLPPDKSANQKLTDKLKSLQVKFPANAAASPVINVISAQPFMLDNNSLGAKALTFNFTGTTCTLTASYHDGERKIMLGMNKWKKANNRTLSNSKLPFPVPGWVDVPSEVAGIATWKDEKTLLLNIRLVEMVNTDTITCTFNEGVVKLTFLNSVVRTGKDMRPELTGHIA